MQFHFKSLRTSMFIFMFLSILILVLLLSYVSLRVVNAKIESVMEQDLLRDATIIEKMYETNLNEMLKSGFVLSKDTSFVNEVTSGNKEEIKIALKNIAEIEQLDVAALVDSNGKIVVSANSDSSNGVLSINGLVQHAISNRIPVVSTEIVPSSELLSENEKLLFLTRIRRIPTLYQKSTAESNYEEDGFGLVAVIPIVQNNESNKFVSAIVLIDLLNRDYRFPDTIKQATNLDVSIFQKDVGISTNVLTKNDNRFIGTLIAENVYNRTLVNGETFIGRVWVINKWTVSVYLPIKNYENKVIGAIGFGTGEDEFRKAPFFFKEQDVSQLIILTAVLAIVLSFIITYIISKKLVKPIYELQESAEKVRTGNLEQGVKISSYKEINELANTFNIMIRYLRKQIIEREREIIKKYETEYQKRKKEQ